MDNKDSVYRVGQHAARPYGHNAIVAPAHTRVLAVQVDSDDGVLRVVGPGTAAENPLGSPSTMHPSRAPTNCHTRPGVNERAAACRLENQLGVASLSPTTPATISPRLNKRPGVAGSPNNTMPSTAVPTAPMPTHTA